MSCAIKNLFDDDDDDENDVDAGVDARCQVSAKQHEGEASRPREAPKQLPLMFTGLSFFSQGPNDHLLILFTRSQ